MANMQQTTTASRAFGGPQRYIQGPGEFENMMEFTSAYGEKALYVIDAFLFENLTDRLKKIYSAGASAFLSVEFGGECCQKEIDRLLGIARKEKIDVIVGVGGGKTCDTTKFVANELDIPRILVPSSASTDAPTSGLGIIYTEQGEHIQAVKMKRNSELVLMDSEIVAKAPVRLFIAGIGDALATYFEARANDATETVNYIGKGYRRCKAAMAIAKMAYDLLLEDGLNAVCAVKRGVVTEEVENIIEANTLLSGLGFENTGCAAAHGIHSGITEIAESHDILHGEKVAFGIVCQMVLENTPRKEMDRIMRFMKEVGLPITLEGIHVPATEENIRVIAHHTVEKNPLIHHEPVFITEDIVANAIWAADELGRRYMEKG